MKNELEAGPELDAAVAKAIDVVGDLINDPLFLGHVFRLQDQAFKSVEVDLVWSPSRNEQAAFEAADRIGLFENYQADLSRRWQNKEWIVRGAQSQRLGDGPTPAVAICRAILKLKGQ